MQLLYNSDSFAVVQFDVPGTTQSMAAPAPHEPLTRGGYEIVDKFARKGIFIEGDVARCFKDGVQALIDAGPSEEALDDYIAGYTALAQQPMHMH